MEFAALNVCREIYGRKCNWYMADMVLIKTFDGLFCVGETCGVWQGVYDYNINIFFLETCIALIVYWQLSKILNNKYNLTIYYLYLSNCTILLFLSCSELNI